MEFADVILPVVILFINLTPVPHVLARGEGGQAGPPLHKQIRDECTNLLWFDLDPRCVCAGDCA